MPETPGMPSPERRKLRAAKGVAVRLGKTDEAARLDAEIRTASLAEHIQRVVDEAPPLTDEQRARLAVLLRGCPPTDTKPRSTDIRRNTSAEAPPLVSIRSGERVES